MTKFYGAQPQVCWILEFTSLNYCRPSLLQKLKKLFYSHCRPHCNIKYNFEEIKVESQCRVLLWWRIWSEFCGLKNLILINKKCNLFGILSTYLKLTTPWTSTNWTWTFSSSNLNRNKKIYDKSAKNKIPFIPPWIPITRNQKSKFEIWYIFL
jgi:hypothetical protein